MYLFLISFLFNSYAQTYAYNARVEKFVNETKLTKLGVFIGCAHYTDTDRLEGYKELYKYLPLTEAAKNLVFKKNPVVTCIQPINIYIAEEKEVKIDDSGNVFPKTNKVICSQAFPIKLGKVEFDNCINNDKQIKLILDFSPRIVEPEIYNPHQMQIMPK